MKNRYYFIFILLLFFVFWIWWLPGPRAAADFSFISDAWLKSQFDLPRVWTERGGEGLGEYGIFLLSSWPVAVIFGLFARLGMSFEIWERTLILLFIFLGGFSIWKLLSLYISSPRAKFIGALLYLVNSYSILLIDGGQIFVAIAYALFPLSLWVVEKSVYSNFSKKILAGLVVTVMGSFDVRFIYLLGLLLIFKVIFEIFVIKREDFVFNLKRWSISALIISIIVLGLNASWVIMQVRVPLSEGTITSLTKLSTNLINIGHPFLLIAPHWYKNIFGRVSLLRWEFIFLPILAILAPILIRRDKNILFWLSVAIIAIFLGKGNSEPFAFFYNWLHNNIPGFAFFRDSSKFFFLVILSYSILISKTTESILEKVENKGFLYLTFITVYFLLLIRPVFLNQMTGTFSNQPKEMEFKSLAKTLQQDNSFGRVFWIPFTAPLTFYDLNHPVVEAMRVFNKIPFAYGVKGEYEIFNFLREASYMGQIFDVAGISYIAYPPLDPRRDEINEDNVKYYYTFLDQISNLSWIDNKVLESKIPLLKTKTHQDRLFITKNSWIVFGSDEIFKIASKSANLRLSDNAIIFAEQKTGQGFLINKFPEAKIILNNKSETDLIATFFPVFSIIFPANQLDITPDKNGWWKNDGKDLISWRVFLQEKYSIDNKDFDLGGGWAVGEGESEFSIHNSQFSNGKILFARVMESSRSGEISFRQSDELIGRIDTLKKDAIVRWHEIGPLKGSFDLIIKTRGDINIINALAVVEAEDLNTYKNTVRELKKRVGEFKDENITKGTPSINYQKLSQTEYKVKISGLDSPRMLVFSSTFHPLWSLEHETSTPVYGFLNGFRIEKDGEYTLKFTPQEFIWEGLYIFGFTAVISTTFLVIFLRKKNKHKA